MWMGTNYGLNRYDGSEISNYFASKQNGLPDNVVNDIKEDEQHRLWMATGYGLCCYDVDKRLFVSYRVSEKDTILNRYSSLAIAGNKIFLSNEKGLLIFDRGRKTFRLVINPTSAAASWLTKICRDSKNRIWLASSYGLWLFDTTKEKFTSFDNPQNDPLFDGYLTDVFEDHAGNIWMGTWNKGLKCLHPESGKIENYLGLPGSHTNVTTITEQINENGEYQVWLSNKPGWLDLKAQSFHSIEITGSGKEMTGTANRMYCDRDNLLWISTTDGVKIYNPKKQFFHTVRLSEGAPITTQGIPLFPLQQGFLLGAQAGDAVLQFDDSARIKRNLSSVAGGEAATLSIQTDQEGNYWISSTDGIVAADPAFRLLHRYHHTAGDSHSLPRNFINSLLFRKDKTIWLFPWQKGVWEMVGNSFKPVLTPSGDTLLPQANISKAIEDNTGNVWLTDYIGGLYKYDPVAGKLSNPITATALTNEYLAGDHIWVVGPSTLFAVNIHDNTVLSYPLPNGYDKRSYDLVPDKSGYIWITVKGGLLAFNIQTKIFRHFTESDGLYSNNADLSLAALNSGRIVMAGNMYLTWFDPSAILDTKATPSLLFTGVQANGIQKEKNEGSYSLNWDEQNISFRWATANFSNPLGNQYYYKLEGVDKDWQYAGNKGLAVYNSLKPGPYTFRYKAATSEGRMSPEASITFVIHPPFWQTWWFRLLCLAIIGFIFFYVVRYVSQRNLKERLLVLAKEQAIERERNRISRDMHDDLGSGLTKIAILSEVIKTRSDNSEASLDKISETARALVDNLDEMVWALNPKNDSLDKLAAYIAEYTHKYLEETGIGCMVKLPSEIPALPLGEEKRRNIFMAVKEFLNNSVKHSKARMILLELKSAGNSFQIQISDDGMGFDPDRQNGMGNGISNMQQRIKDIGGVARLESSSRGTLLHITCTA